MVESFFGSGNMRILSSKSSLITISSELENVDKEDLREVHDDSEGSEDDSDFETPPPLKKGAMIRSKVQSSKSK